MKKSNKLFLINILLTVTFLIGLYIFDNTIRGNATNGKIENSIYYVKDSLGTLTEVSKFVYFTNYVYTCFTVFLIITGVISLAILQYRFVNYCKRNKNSSIF